MPPKKVKLSDAEQVTAYIQQLDSELADAIQFLRAVILGTDPEIGEQIKWNSPAFYFTGEMKLFDPKEYKRDIIVLNLHRGRIMLVLPTGATIRNATALLEGKYNDGRRLITFSDKADIQSKEPELRNVIREWLSLVEK